MVIKQVYYSVPWEYAHKQVEIRAATRTIEVFCDNSRIAARLRSHVSLRAHLGGRSLLRKALMCPPKRRLQPERYAKWRIKLYKII
jgi:hypothetical protein